MIYVTWQPAVAEAGSYFLTKIDDSGLELTIGQIMEIAHGIEDLEVDAFDLCSIIKTGDKAEVIY